MNYKKPLVSVIVPVYNSAYYLPKCCESLFAQDYPNLEVVLVDDGSTDESPVLCDQLKREHANVVVVHQENGGESGARNTGLSVAKGEYIMWVDSDDWVTPTWISSYMDVAIAQDVDIVVAGWIRGRFEHPEPFTQFLLNHVEHTIWISCARKSVYHGRQFASHTIGCDALMLTNLMWYAHSVYVMPRPSGYHYVANEQSVTRVQNLGTRIDWPARADDELNFVHRVAPKYMSLARFDVMRGAAVMVGNIKKLAVPMEERSAKKLLLSKLHGYIWNGLRHLPIKYMKPKDYRQVLKALRAVL